MIIQAMSLPNPNLLQQLNGICALPHLGVIQAQGEDAANFLHNQLTNDVLLLPVGQARLAAFCNAKGRMQASFVVIKMAPDTVLLVLPQDLLPQTLKRLTMFVLRAKVKLSDASGQWQLRGLMGETARAALGDAAPWQAVAWACGHAVALYPAMAGEARQARAFWIGALDQPVPEAPPLTAEQWAWGSVLSGVPFVTQPVFEAFVPQMLNYESVDGVSFKKGCYPGQEVVARSQFRGAIKRRAYLAHADAELVAGADVYAPADPEQPCGTVVQAAPAPNGGWDAIVSLQIAAAKQGGLHATAVDGTALTLGTLPYLLLEDI